MLIGYCVKKLRLLWKDRVLLFIALSYGYANWLLAWKNLESFFWTCAVVMVASYTFIVEISLFSFGFSGAQDVTGNIPTTFRLGSEQLSSLPRHCTAKIKWCATTACLFAGWFNNTLSAIRPLNSSVTLTNEVGKMWKKVAKVCFEGTVPPFVWMNLIFQDS
jgi:hypothetical protein